MYGFYLLHITFFWYKNKKKEKKKKTQQNKCRNYLWMSCCNHSYAAFMQSKHKSLNEPNQRPFWTQSEP